MMLQMLQEEKLLRDQQKAKIERLTNLIISSSKLAPTETNTLDKYKVYRSISDPLPRLTCFHCTQRFNRRETWCFGKAAPTVGEEGSHDNNMLTAHCPRDNFSLHGFGKPGNTVERLLQQGRGPAFPLLSRPQFALPVCDQPAFTGSQFDFPSVPSAPLHAPSVINSSGKDAGPKKSDEQCNGQQIESYKIELAKAQQDAKDATDKLHSASLQIEAVNIPMHLLVICIVRPNYCMLTFVSFFPCSQLSRTQMGLERQLRDERERHTLTKLNISMSYGTVWSQY